MMDEVLYALSHHTTPIQKSRASRLYSFFKKSIFQRSVVKAIVFIGNYTFDPCPWPELFNSPNVLLSSNQAKEKEERNKEIKKRVDSTSPNCLRAFRQI